ncbi:MAG: TIGR01777 family oxidoreductase [Corynebacterium sp.]|nr:TIGR01777 family oxidoreductase [Corynebacterium sp.]
MGFHAFHDLPFPRQLVWDWHTRPGAVTRLTPSFVPMSVTREADNLATGTTTFSLPAGLSWVARHDLAHYRAGAQFSDVCLTAPIKQLANWRHTHTFADLDDGTRITDDVATRVPGKLLTPTFAYRQRQLLADLQFLERLAALSPEPGRRLTVAMTGSGGSVGTGLRAQLTTAGHDVIRLVRRDPAAGQRRWDPDQPAVDLLDGVDVLVHLAGEPIFGRFNDAHKNAIRDSRVGPTTRLAQLVADSPSVTAMVSASAVGYYGADRGDEKLTEDSERGDGFLADVVSAWEAATAPARDAGKRVVTVRTGLAMNGGAGMLPLLSALFSTGLGGAFGDGSMWMSWVAQDDLTDVYARAVVDESLAGPVNAVSPAPVTNREMADVLAAELNRPARMPLPTFGPAMLLGREGAAELALASQRVLPERLHSAGHTFRFDALAAALAHELGGEALLAPAGEEVG